MGTPRRRGTETSETRATLLDVTERVMRDDGYAAVSSRRIAKEAGVTPALVHYYFGTLDELFLAVLRRRSEQQLARYERSAAERPLHALWRQSIEPAGTELLLEFVALANHREVVRDELAAYAERFRAMHVEAVADRIADVPEGMTPEVLHVLIVGLSRTLVMERSLGMTTGHEQTQALVEGFLDRLEP